MANPSYSDLVNRLQEIKPGDPHFVRRINELVSINELLATLNTAKSLEETLDIILLTLLGQCICLKGAIFVKSAGNWRTGICKGIKPADLNPKALPPAPKWDHLPKIIHLDESAPEDMASLKGVFHRAFPIRNEGSLVGLICLGASMLPNAGRDKEEMLATIADFGGVLIGNHSYRDDLEQVNKQLQIQLFQLNTLYEITGSFARCLENEQVFHILSQTLMGQFLISRCAVVVFGRSCKVLFQRNLKLDSNRLGKAEDFAALDDWPEEARELCDIECERLADFMKANKLRYGLPIAGEGRREGVLLLGNRLDRKPLSDPDKNFVLSLARQSAAAVENIRLQKEAAEKKRMERELQLARDIQQKLLPKGVPIIEGYDLAVEMRPYYDVGGDFYDFIPMCDGRLIICLADVSGKSLPASMIMSTAQSSLRALNAFDSHSPKDIIEKLNVHMWQSTQSNKFVTMFYAVLDPVEHQLTYINAGHNHPIMVHPDGSTELLGTGGMVVGLFPSAVYQVGSVPFQKGAELVIYTDGLSEVTHPKNNEIEYGDERMMQTLMELGFTGSVEEKKNRMIEDAMAFSGNQMVDDLTLLLIRRNA